ncbi:hypothetical protein OGAPHI_005184 [Ogataea philodendri]|uniref:Uncharacterized protein n=1 Tax=Ogataea philodendri TaxID=1378263 RepID=A0A9P8T2L5_9ASCO|nr:uncharacterized protein OGAPHI_005184 [Ogataea philodendri]KAH3663781.1 hypothetical protein OGAPHI_005184 [Ogataea philodendri]
MWDLSPGGYLVAAAGAAGGGGAGDALAEGGIDTGGGGGVDTAAGCLKTECPPVLERMGFLVEEEQPPLEPQQLLEQKHPEGRDEAGDLFGGCVLNALGKSFHPPTSFLTFDFGGGGGVPAAKDGLPSCGDCCNFRESRAVFGAYGLAPMVVGTGLTMFGVTVEPTREAAALYGLVCAGRTCGLA